MIQLVYRINGGAIGTKQYSIKVYGRIIAHLREKDWKYEGNLWTKGIYGLEVQRVDGEEFSEFKSTLKHWFNLPIENEKD